MVSQATTTSFPWLRWSGRRRAPSSAPCWPRRLQPEVLLAHLSPPRGWSLEWKRGSGDSKKRCFVASIVLVVAVTGAVAEVDMLWLDHVVVKLKLTWPTWVSRSRYGLQPVQAVLSHKVVLSESLQLGMGRSVFRKRENNVKTLEVLENCILLKLWGRS